MTIEYLPAGRLTKATRLLTNGAPVSIQTDYDSQAERGAERGQSPDFGIDVGDCAR